MLPSVEWEREYRFAAIHTGGIGKGVRARLKAAGLKDWRFDFADTSQKIAIECEGGTWSKGRHTRGAGFEKDCIKYAEAAILGWTVIRVTSSMVYDDRAIDIVERLYYNRGAGGR